MNDKGRKIRDAAAQALLRPIIRFFLRHGYKLPEIVELTKQTLVEEARTILQYTDVSVSKLSVLTGVHRAEVSRLLLGDSKLDNKATILARIIGQWQLSKRFLDKNGNPKPLKFEGTNCEFTLLVESVTKEISPYTIFFELERSQSISRKGEYVNLQVKDQGTRQDYLGAMQVIGEDIDTLIQATEANINQTGQTHLQLRTSFDNISLEELDAISKWLLEKGKDLHQEVREYLGEKDLDINPSLSKDGGGSVSFGTFSFVKRPTEIRIVQPRKRGRKKNES